MKTFDYVVTDAQGIHARPAGELVKEVKKYTSAITIAKNGKAVDCKRIFGMMGLGVKQNDTVTFTFEGDDEETACAAVEAFMKANL